MSALALALAACGSTGGSFANKPRPPVPVNLSVYVNNSRVSVSPPTVGAGPVVFIVTNQADKTESISVTQGGLGTTTLASTGPINPQATAMVTVNFTDPGEYSLSPSSGGSTAAQQATPSNIQPATLHVGAARPNGSNQLLQP
ncbi:MAG: hypothetical protein JOZ73_02530 [Solirubrobacterales bacterium]|nr:hypothetical protein [Solirubrobacterales bacterium]